jgi:hypothetical protein
MTEARERILSWTAAIVAAAYFVWVGVSLSRGAQGMAASMESLGAAVPDATRFILDHRIWLPVGFCTGAILVLAKEAAMRDKRSSMMITMLLFIVFRVLADAIIRLYYLPLFDLMKKLSS